MPYDDNDADDDAADDDDDDADDDDGEVTMPCPSADRTKDK